VRCERLGNTLETARDALKKAGKQWEDQSHRALKELEAARAAVAKVQERREGNLSKVDGLRGDLDKLSKEDTEAMKTASQTKHTKNMDTKSKSLASALEEQVELESQFKKLVSVAKKAREVYDQNNNEVMLAIKQLEEVRIKCVASSLRTHELPLEALPAPKELAGPALDRALEFVARVERDVERDAGLPGLLAQTPGAPPAQMKPEVDLWPALTHHTRNRVKEVTDPSAKGNGKQRARRAPDRNTQNLEHLKGRVFACSLSDVLLHEQAVLGVTSEVPLILKSLAEAITRLGGASTEGIFRVPADAGLVKKLKAQMELGDYAIPGNDPNLPAAVLKLWLRELKDPLIPDSLYDAAMAAGESWEKCKDLLARLPDVHARALEYVVAFLKELAKGEAQTKMGTGNLAMVFAPGFLRCPSDNPAVILANSNQEKAFVLTLINNLE
jgi:hypothetical protein